MASVGVEEELVKEELMLLRSSEEKMVAALKKNGTDILCQNLYKRDVISKETEDKFSSLDQDNLEPGLMVRYLLQYVYEAVKSNKLVLNSFIDVLSEVDTGVADELRKYLRKCKLSKRVEETREDQSEVSLAEKRSQVDMGEYRLYEHDQAVLTKLLIECSHKWEEIAIELGLLRYQIEECRKGSSNQLRLYEVLYHWLSMVECPTVAKLKVALSGNMVAMSSLGNQLEEYFLNQAKVISEKQCQKPTYCSGDIKIARGKAALLGLVLTCSNPLKYQWYKNSAHLSDGEAYCGTSRPILFISHVALDQVGQYECRITNDQCSVVATEKMNLKLLTSTYTRYFDSLYSVEKEVPENHWPPVTMNTFINLALVGKYARKNNDLAYAVRGDMDDIIEAAKEKVKYEKVFGEYKSGSLLLVEGRPGSGKTTLMHKVTRDWALKGTILMGVDVVVLVPIKLFGTSNKSITLSDIFIKYIQNAEVKNKVMDDIYEKNGEGVCFIIDGLDEYEYHSDQDTIIFKLICKQILPLAMVIVASRPVGTALVRAKGPVANRIEILGFKKDQIIEYVYNYYKEDKNEAFKLISYLKAHINVYRMCYLPVHAAMICFLFSKLGDKIPHTETKIYECFTRFTILRKLVGTNSQHTTVNSLRNLPEGLQEYFNNICELAFDMIIHSKQAMLKSQTQFPLSCPGSDKSSLGLVIIDSTAELFGMDDLYTFLHLTFQEYLAAFYLSGLEDEELVISKTKGKKANLQMVWKFYYGMVTFKNDSLVLKYTLSDPDMGSLYKPQNVVVVSMQQIVRRSFKLKPSSELNMDSLYKLQCAFESQQQIVCHKVLELGKANTLHFMDHNFIPNDFLAISYVISNACYKISKLSFVNCTLEKEGVELLIEKLSSDQLSNIKCLQYHNRSHSVFQIIIINMLLKKFPCLEILDLENTSVADQDVRELTRNIELANLKALKINLSISKFTTIFDDLPMLKFNSKKLQLLQYGCSKFEKYYKCGRFYFMKGLVAFTDVVCYNPTECTLYYANASLKSPVLLNYKEYLQHCHKLALINCGITDDDLKVLVEFIGTELDSLYLDFNRITGEGAVVLANHLEKCTKLEVFSAHCNQIDDFGALAITRALKDCLKILDLQCNAITADCADSLLTAGEFRMDYMVWEGTSGVYPLYLFNLEPVYRYIAMICENGYKLSLSTAAACSTNLKTLDLSHCIFRSDGAVTLAEGLKYWTNLKQLDLYQAWISSSGAVALAEGLKCCINLQTVNLGSNDISCSGAVALAKGLKCCTNLQNLKLWNNNIGSHGAGEVLKCCTSLQVLDLRRNSLNSSGTVTLAEGLNCCTNLKALDLGCNSIKSSGAVALAEGLKSCINLLTLDLNSNSIDSRGAVALAEGLKSCINLQTLNLNGNNIDSDGTVALAEALKSCNNLQILALNSNSIDSHGAVALAKGLKCCTNLEFLDLSYNSIDSSGTVALADGLKCCTNLHTLHLAENSIGLDGAVGLAEGLKCWNNMQVLILRKNNIGCEGALALAESLWCRTNVQVLDVWGNSIGSNGAVALHMAVKYCTL